MRGVVDQFVRWYIGGLFRPRTDDADWCKHIFREHSTVADKHANQLMDNGDSGGAVGNTWYVFQSADLGSTLAHWAWTLTQQWHFVGFHHVDGELVA